MSAIIDRKRPPNMDFEGFAEHGRGLSCRDRDWAVAPATVLRGAMTLFSSTAAFPGTKKCDFHEHSFLWKSPDTSIRLRERGLIPVWETAVSTCPPRGNLVDGLPRAPTFDLLGSDFFGEGVGF